MAIGYLKMQVRAAQGAVPVEGARVWVLDAEENPLYCLVTDDSGETETVSLEAPDSSSSKEPGCSEAPYASYSVAVEAEGFEPVFVGEVPVFAGETAVLPVSPVPLPENEYSQTMEEITVGAPAVAFAHWRPQEGSSIGPRVLRQVVIPDPITVHLGAPDVQAANVRVPFLDYVKNVTGSEIYPTWPEAALKANIYAIMTFALNRVYTEWYRSRGYDFDITNHTAYDQYYVPGRPIYDSISDAVDEVFGEYVRRQGQNAPYFTSFCNGTTATCMGLSQWGTVWLADRGYSPLQILRYYYPDDIEIARTDIVTGELSSYPGTALRVGSSGLDVQTIQAYLARIRRSYPAIPAIADPPGVFGAGTRAAVQKFQSIFNLAADGIVGRATWYELSKVYTAVTRLAELDSEGSAIGIGTVPPSAVLRQGSRGQDVVTLQYLLNVLSQYDPAIPAPVQDGIFGSETRRAVVAFQRAAGLDPDGIVGAKTWQALYNRYLGIEESRPGSKPDVIIYTVRAGDTLWQIARRYGTTVEAIQQANGLTGDRILPGQELRIPL